MDKKGSLVDSISGMFWLVIIGLTIVICYFIWFSFSDVFVASITSTEPANSTTLNVTLQAVSDVSAGFNTLDYMYPMLVIGALIVSLIFAFKTGANLAYAFVSLFFWALALIMSFVITDIWTAFAATFSTTVLSLPIISFILSNANNIVLAWVFLLSVVMFTRNKKEEEQLRSSDQVFQ